MLAHPGSGQVDIKVIDWASSCAADAGILLSLAAVVYSPIMLFQMAAWLPADE